jgi:homoserine O-acetyltransferase
MVRGYGVIRIVVASPHHHITTSPFYHRTIKNINQFTVEYLTVQEPFELESGEQLPAITIAYTTHGQLSPARDNVIWVFHALTANAEPLEWWAGLVGEGQLIDPQKYFIVCANMLGSCYGSTCAKSINPNTQQPYGKDFPLITIRDMVAAHQLLRQHLGLEEVLLGIGGSMGGQQVLEWAVQEPEYFKNICVLASNACHSPWGIAFNEAQRMAIEADSSLYTDVDKAGHKGLAAARAIAMLSYRNYRTYQRTQSEEHDAKLDDFRASSYQQYQGQKLYQRFHPLAYLSLSKAMDSHNLGRGRGSAEEALACIQANALIIGIQSDVLFPVEEQAFLANHIPRAKLEIIESTYGHDGFLIEYAKISELLKSILQENIEWLPASKYKLKEANNSFGLISKKALPGTEYF